MVNINTAYRIQTSLKRLIIIGIIFFSGQAFSQTDKVDSVFYSEWRLTKLSIDSNTIFDANNPDIFIDRYINKLAKQSSGDTTGLRIKAEQAFQVMSQSFWAFTSEGIAWLGKFSVVDTDTYLSVVPANYQIDGRRIRVDYDGQDGFSNSEGYIFKLNDNELTLIQQDFVPNYAVYKRVIIE